MPEDFEIAFETFVAKREALNDQLLVSRQTVDRLMEERPEPPTIRWLAQIEVHLKIRRDQLDTLVALDDDFVDLLVRTYGDNGASGSVA